MFGAFGDSFDSKKYHDNFEIKKNSAPVVYGFAGRQLDSESGLYYNRARMYNADMGKFTTKDPMGLDAGDVNLYRYVGNQPLKYKDPSGKIFGFDDALIMIATVVLPAVVQGISAGVTTWRMTGNFDQAVSAAGSGAVSGALAGATPLAFLAFGVQSTVALGVAAGVDLIYTAFANTGTVNPSDVVTGVNSIINPNSSPSQPTSNPNAPAAPCGL
jgi:RHS repeat-associated protein